MGPESADQKRGRGASPLSFPETFLGDFACLAFLSASPHAHKRRFPHACPSLRLHNSSFPFVCLCCAILHCCAKNRAPLNGLRLLRLYWWQEEGDQILPATPLFLPTLNWSLERSCPLPPPSKTTTLPFPFLSPPSISFLSLFWRNFRGFQPLQKEGRKRARCCFCRSSS